MSFQIFLHGKILGTEPFLLNSADAAEGRIWWAALLSEVLPRALLAELGLSSVLLGASGGGEFLLVIPVESLGRADEFCRTAAAAVAERSGGMLRLAWASTETLGDWSDVRKRLSGQMQERMGAPLGIAPSGFEPFEPENTAAYFADFEKKLPEASHVGWSPDDAGAIVAGAGKHTWPIGTGPDAIPFARHAAPADDGAGRAHRRVLARRAGGRKAWGVLRGDVDSFAPRLRRAVNVEEHIRLATMYKQFFAGELQMRCSLPEYWKKVTLLWAGGDDFAVYGAWNALISLAREIQRLFSVFVDANLKEYAGVEGKTISMAIALARDDEPLAAVLGEAGLKLEIAKASGKDSIHLFGRTLEWKQLAEAADTRHTMTRLIAEFGCSPQFLYELAGFYADAEQSGPVLLGGRGRHDRVERPWRFHRRLNTMTASTAARGREFQRLRAALLEDFAGRRAKQIRLRPQGRVALEWAWLETQRG